MLLTRSATPIPGVHIGKPCVRGTCACGEELNIMGYNITASQYYNKPTTRAVVQPTSAAALAAIVVHPVLERAVQSPASSDP